MRNRLSTSMEAAFVDKFDEPLLIHELRTIVLFNALLRKKRAVGLARSSQGDVGAMHLVGTRVCQDGKTMTSYAATHKVPCQLMEAYVKALLRVGQIAFPDVLAVIQGTEGDTGLKSCAAIAGNAEANRVGFSINTSVDLGNLSHFDTNEKQLPVCM